MYTDENTDHISDSYYALCYQFSERADFERGPRFWAENQLHRGWIRTDSHTFARSRRLVAGVAVQYRPTRGEVSRRRARSDRLRQIGQASRQLPHPHLR